MARAKRPDARKNARARRRSLSAAESARIVEAIRAGAARNEIARQFGRSPSTVSKIATAAGLSFDRAATAAATEAKRVDMEERRSQVAERLLSDAERLRERIWQPAIVYRWHEGELLTDVLPSPTFRDVRDIAISLGVLIDKQTALIGGVEDIEHTRAAIVDIRAYARHKLGRPPIEGAEGA
jgi:hypothetical protein